MFPVGLEGIGPAPDNGPAPVIGSGGVAPMPSLGSPNPIRPTLGRQGSGNPFLHALQQGFGQIGPQPKPGEAYTGPTSFAGKLGAGLRAGGRLLGRAGGNAGAGFNDSGANRFME